MKIGLRSGVSLAVLVTASVAGAQVMTASSALFASDATLQDPAPTPAPSEAVPAPAQQVPPPAQPRVERSSNFFGLPLLGLLGLGGAAGAAALSGGGDTATPTPTPTPTPPPASPA